MALFRFRNVVIDAMAFQSTGTEVTSSQIEDRLAPLFEALKLPFGTLERLSGVVTRNWWPVQQAPSLGAIGAAREALEKSTVPLDKIGMVMSCSVCRDHFEPATACHVHRGLELPSTTMAFDISNACLGFSNGLLMGCQMIESGAMDAVLVVTGENPGVVIENTTRKLLANPTGFTREEFISLLPTFTLGCGAAAFVLCHEKIGSGQRARLCGAAAFSESEYDQLCRGNTDFAVLEEPIIPAIMHTEASTLITAASHLARVSWNALSNLLGWTSEELKAVFPHQIGKQANSAFYENMGVDYAKVFGIYAKFGNMVSAALPAAMVLGNKELSLNPGDKSVTVGFGSGLNSIFFGVQH